MKEEMDVTEAAKVMSKLGASKGGKARAEALTAEERREIARNAIMTRWSKTQKRSGKDENDGEKILKATHGSPDHPLRIGGIEIPCYVLEDGRRVIVRSGMIHALDMSAGRASKYPVPGDRLTKFLDGKILNPFISHDLVDRIQNPILFKTHAGSHAYGYEATILADICEAVLNARQAGALQKQQDHIAARCEILVRGFARVGIIALVDEATGYQADRDREELHKILAAFISEELLPWAKRFPDDFYQQMFRLWGWSYRPIKGRRPRAAGKVTSEIVYEKLPPGVLNELRRKNPVVKDGRRGHKHHQFLTDDVGHPYLQKHLIAVTTLMRAARTRKEFQESLERAFPSQDKSYQIEMALGEEGEYEVANKENLKADAG